MEGVLLGNARRQGLTLGAPTFTMRPLDDWPGKTGSTRPLGPQYDTTLVTALPEGDVPMKCHDFQSKVFSSSSKTPTWSFVGRGALEKYLLSERKLFTPFN